MVNSWLQAVGRKGEKWMDLGGNGLCGFVPHKKYICAGNTGLGVIVTYTIIDTMVVDQKRPHGGVPADSQHQSPRYMGKVIWTSQPSPVTT